MPKKKILANHKQKSKNLNRYFSVLMFAIFLMAFIFAWLYLRDSKHFLIQTVRIEAPFVHTGPEKLKQRLMPYTKTSFFSVNVNRLQKVLMSDPWVAKVSVRRVFPNSLLIKITEQKAVARWGNNSVLNADGKIFTPALNSIPNNLPMLYGPIREINQVWAVFQKINPELAAANLQLSELVLNARHAWRLKLNNGTQVILGRFDIEQRIARFIRVYPKVFANRPAPKSVDLRYNNGLAVNWGNDFNS